MNFFCIAFLVLALAASASVSAQTGGRPPRLERKTETPPAPPATLEVSDAPLTEAEFFKLVNQARAKSIKQSDVAAVLSDQGIAFEATDAVVERASKLGAGSIIIDALLRAEQARKRRRYAPEDAAPRRTAKPDPNEPAVQNRDPLPGEAEAEPTDGPPPNLSKQPFLDQARYYALSGLEEIPNFIATQSIQRQKRTRQTLGKWRNEDTLETEVTYENSSGEKVKLLTRNGQPTRETYETIGGSTSVGGFSAQLASPFIPESKTTFKETGREKYRGRDCVIYDYSVARVNSKHHLQGGYSGEPYREAIVAYRGSMWIDSESKHVLRVELSAFDIPRGFPLTVAETVVEYDWVTIAGKQYWMPISGEVLLGNETEEYYSRNVTKFHNYRKFDADVKIVD